MISLLLRGSWVQSDSCWLPLRRECHYWKQLPMPIIVAAHKHRGPGRSLGCFLPLAVWIAPSGTVRVVLREEASRSSPAILPTFQYADQIDLLFTFLKRKFHSLNQPSSTQSHLNSVLSTSPTPSHLNVPLHYVMLAWQTSSKFGNIVPTSLFQLHGKCPTLHKDRHFPEFSIKSA